MRHWSDYAHQRESVDGDGCDQLLVYNAFAAADLDMGELLVALSQRDRFRTRDAYELPNIPPPAGPQGSANTVAERRKLLLDFNRRELAWLVQVVPQEDRLLLDQQMEAARTLELELAQ